MLFRSLLRKSKKAREIAKKGLLKKSKETVEFVKTNPGEAIGFLAGEVVLLKGTGKAFKLAGKGKQAIVSKIDNFKGKNLDTTKKITVNVDGKKTDLKVVRDIPREDLASQVRRAGTTTGAVSTQADKLLGRVIRRSRTVRKPIPNEKA